jgi:predicted dehydrogenase
MNTDSLSRRGFVKNVAVAGLALHSVPLFAAQTGAAPRKFKVGLVGCGGRGTGALANLKEAAAIVGVEIEVVAVTDAFQERVAALVAKNPVPADKCFVGFDGYRKVLEQPIDIALFATPPNFRPVHFEAAVAAGKHCFIEKPVAVDPPGIRRVLAAGEVAKKKGLTVVAGAQRHHMSTYLRNHHAVRAGAIGKIMGGTVSWNQAALWYRERNPGENDASYMARNWVSFLEMSGDHIVEQHFHNLDVANWFIGRTPIAAVGFGGRARRKTGNQFDFFSVDYNYGEGCHIHSQCRQVNGCYNLVGEYLTGTEGTVYPGGKLEVFSGKKIDTPEYPTHDNGQVQEHVAMLKAIIAGQPINDAQYVADSTLTAIMGRIAAYTGQMVRWTDLTTPEGAYYNLRLSPSAEDFEKGTVVASKEGVVSVPGKEVADPAPAATKKGSGKKKA